MRIEVWVFFEQKIYGFLGNVLHIFLGPKAIANSAGNTEFVLDKTKIEFVISDGKFVNTDISRRFGYYRNDDFCACSLNERRGNILGVGQINRMTPSHKTYTCQKPAPGGGTRVLSVA